MKKVIVLSTLLLFVILNDALAYPGISLKGNGLSFGNIRGKGSVVDGFSLTFGSFESKWLDKINGISVSFFPASRQINGLSISPFLFAETKHNIKGIVVSPLFIAPSSEVAGIFIGGGVSWNTVDGIAVSVISVITDLNGIAVSAMSVITELKGIAVSVFPLISEVNGLLISFGYIAEEINGVSISIWGNSSLEGIIFWPQYLLGTEGITGIKGITKKVNGLQIGLFNYTEELHGVQIGLLNYAGNNPFFLRIIPGINIHF